MYSDHVRHACNLTSREEATNTQGGHSITTPSCNSLRKLLETGCYPIFRSFLPLSSATFAVGISAPRRSDRRAIISNKKATNIPGVGGLPLSPRLLLHATTFL